jgi:hypothetical protein
MSGTEDHEYATLRAMACMPQLMWREAYSIILKQAILRN